MSGLVPVFVTEHALDRLWDYGLPHTIEDVRADMHHAHHLKMRKDTAEAIRGASGAGYLLVLSPSSPGLDAQAVIVTIIRPGDRMLSQFGWSKCAGKDVLPAPRPISDHHVGYIGAKNLRRDHLKSGALRIESTFAAADALNASSTSPSE